MPPPLRVLCVDDNRDAADSTAALLLATGFDARACYCGADALREAVAFDPDVFLIDLNMPRMNGDVLAGLVRGQSADRRVVLVAVTAMSDEQAADRIAKAGFDLHLVKPVPPTELLETLTAVSRAWGPHLGKRG